MLIYLEKDGIIINNEEISYIQEDKLLNPNFIPAIEGVIESNNKNEYITVVSIFLKNKTEDISIFKYSIQEVFKKLNFK